MKRHCVLSVSAEVAVLLKLLWDSSHCGRIDFPLNLLSVLLITAIKLEIAYILKFVPIVDAL